jgi:ABC-type multidrug transport system fused ATPase/permease subunit
MSFFKLWNNYRSMTHLKGRSITILLIMSLLSTISEALGIGIFYPIFEFVKADGNLNELVNDSDLWLFLLEFFEILNVELSLASLLISAFLLFFGRQIFMYVRLVYSTLVHYSLVKHLANKLFRKYLICKTEYHDKLPVGAFTNVVVQETQAAITGIMQPIALVTILIMLFVFVIMLLLISWQMTIVASIILIISSQLPKIWTQQSEVVGRDIVKSNTDISSFLVDRLRSMRLVRLSGTELAERREFKLLSEIQRKYIVHAAILQSKTEVFIEPVVILITLLIFYFGVGVLNLGIELMGLYMVVSFRIMPIVKGVLIQWQKIRAQFGALEIVSDRIKEMTLLEEKDTGSINFLKLNQGITFQSVTFKYPNANNNALDNLNLSIPAKKLTAIVGPSGGGKSTLIDLLPRLRLPTSGSIKFDNVPLENYSIKSLREGISFAPQDPQIFNGTVKEHILYGSLVGTDSDVRKAAQLAGAEEFIDRLPDGFDTRIGEGAAKLSGGQRQRLDLARTLVHKPLILLLDEPTSNLDANSVAKFYETIKTLRKDSDLTIVIVAHQLNNISDADQIVVLNQGVVEASGKHEELLDSKCWYAEAWKLQNYNFKNG